MDKIFEWGGWTLTIAIGDYFGRMLWYWWRSPRIESTYLLDRSSGKLVFVFKNNGRTAAQKPLINIRGFQTSNILNSGDFAFGKTPGLMLYSPPSDLLPYGIGVLPEMTVKLNGSFPKQIEVKMYFANCAPVTSKITF